MPAQRKARPRPEPQQRQKVKNVELSLPAPLGFLAERHPYKVVYGGRGKGASWSMARALLVLGLQFPIRVLCAREIQTSLDESVHQLLSDQIIELGLQYHYTVQTKSIFGRPNKDGWRCEFSFEGLKHNITSIKSMEAFDIVWIEEAQAVTEESWKLLLPTIRQGRGLPTPEVWVTFNPFLDTDATYMRWVLNPPPGAVVRKLTYRDNPWFPDFLENQRKHDLDSVARGKINQSDYDTVWEGDTQSAAQGAIYELEMQQATRERRICNVPLDATRPVDTFWDLGFGDSTAVIFAQDMGPRYHIVDFIQQRGRTINWFLIQLQQRPYRYRAHWVPHDALDVRLHHNLGGDRSRSIEMLMRDALVKTPALGSEVRMVPKMGVIDGINMGRTIFPQCWFDSTRCTLLLEALRRYQWGKTMKNGVIAKAPLHDIFSHGADGFRGFALCVGELSQQGHQHGAPQVYHRTQRALGWMR